MIDAAGLLQRLKAEQQKLAAEALGQPSGRDAFEYGRVVGMHAGLGHAQQVLLSMLKDDEERGKDL